METHTGRVDTWFGSSTDSQDRTRFRIRRDDRSGVYRDWIIKPDVQETRIPGTNRTYVEHLGFFPATVTWTLYFDNVDAYNAMLSRLMTTGTLCVLAGFQSLKGTEDHDLGRDYEVLDHVLLRAIDDSPHFIGGHVEAEVTFQRAVDPVTRTAVVL